MLLIGLLTGKVVIGYESRLEQLNTNEKVHELRSKNVSTTDVKDATRKLIELAAIKTKFAAVPKFTCILEVLTVAKLCSIWIALHFSRKEIIPFLNLLIFQNLSDFQEIFSLVRFRA